VKENRKIYGENGKTDKENEKMYRGGLTWGITMKSRRKQHLLVGVLA
jgi:hypothetical protein